MSYLFYEFEFNGDISNWNVSNVEDMSYMFMGSKFTGENGDISQWDVSNVKDMRYMFQHSSLYHLGGFFSKGDQVNMRLIFLTLLTSQLDISPFLDRKSVV